MVPASQAPWPSMRGGPDNLGRARVVPERRDWPVRTFHTDGPVFSTPIIGPEEQIYLGSADGRFYRFDPESGRCVWSFQTDEIIDSAACIGRDGTIWVPGGDGRIYGLDAEGKERWRYDRMLDRTRATPSTIYWWEANVCEGPNGWLYAGSDDFYFYAIEPFGGVRWASPTGLHIWAAPAFENDRVFVPSFDRNLWAFDLTTGRTRWRRNLGNFMASSPAVAGGLVFVASFDHHVYALDAADGSVVWRTATGGPVYASVAVDDDQVVVGSADGTVWALALRTGAVRWTRWLGDAIRGSIGVGEHLYVPGGDGWLTALGHDGSVAWRHDTRRPGTLCHLNASVAVGRHGVATASASGDVVYVPFGAVPDAPREPASPDGTRLVVCSPGGAAGEPVGPRDTVGVRVLHTEDGVTGPGVVRTANAPIAPDGSQVHVRTDPGAPVRVRGTYAAAGTTHAFDEEVEVPWVESGSERSLAEGFRASRLSIQAPSIVPTFDQVGLASLAIDVGILRRDGERVIAWGVQRFGMDASGEAVGVPEPRVLYYAFEGTFRDGTLELESGECLFEITAFPVPLTRLRLVAQQREGRLVGGSLVAETDAGSVLRALPSSLPSGFWKRVRGWLPDEPGLADLAALARIARHNLPLLPAFLRGMWKPWGLLDAERRFHGIGAFQVEDSAERRSSLELVEVRAERGAVVATWSGGDRLDAPGILLVREDRPVAWPYSRKLHVERREGVPVQTRLDVRGAAWDEAWILRDHQRVARVTPA